MDEHELQAFFDFLETKRGDKLGCPICAWNSWTYLGGVAVPGRQPDGSYDYSKALEMAAMQCQNCYHVGQLQPQGVG
jgi:hypothetical protein